MFSSSNVLNPIWSVTTVSPFLANICSPFPLKNSVIDSPLKYATVSLLNSLKIYGEPLTTVDFILRPSSSIRPNSTE